MGRRAASTLLLLAGLAAQPGCRAVVRSPVDGKESAPNVDAALLAGMNPYILAEGIDLNLRVEVDWVEGGEPSPGALQFLEELLLRYGPPERSVEIVRDDAIPLEEIEGLGGRGGLEELVSRHLDGNPRAADHELIYILYVPRSEPFFGESLSGSQQALRVQRGGEPVRVQSILLFYEEIERDALLWITAAKVERSILVHELGHLLGLVSNPEHTQRGHPHHCTEPGCVLNRPHAGSSLYNAPAAFFAGRIPDDYCRLCRADIARVKELWRTLARDDDDFAARLARERLAREYEAHLTAY